MLRFPKEGTWGTAPKKQPIDAKAPVELWKGELDNGQFVELTVTLLQGKGERRGVEQENSSSDRRGG